MKKYVTFYVFVLGMLCCSSAYGINDYQIGDTLFTIAKTGLNLRQAPNTQSEVLSNISYATQIETLEERPPSWRAAPDSVRIIAAVDMKSREGTKAYWMKGRWVKIKYGGQEGYVFDGYLSKNEPLEIDTDGNIEDLRQYIKRNYNLQASKVCKYESSFTAVTTEVYDNGCVVEQIATEKMGTTTIHIHGFSLEEIMLYITYRNQSTNRYDMVHLIKVDQQNQDYRFEGSITGIMVKPVGAMLVISISGWC